MTAVPLQVPCRRCGVHPITDVGFRVAGRCHNCGWFGLVPVDAI